MSTQAVRLQVQKVPKLRFTDFSVEWEKKKLRDVAKFWNGKAHEQDILENGKYIVVNSKFISQDGEVRKYSDKQISPLRKDDVVIVMSDIPNGKAIGKCFLVDQDGVYTLNQRIGGIKSKEIISQFLFRILNRNKYFLKFDNGVSQTNLRKDEILRCPVVFPSLPEQKKIAGFLEYADEWIENLRTQKESLEIYKKEMMHKIFTQEIRFKDDDGNDFSKWEEKRLGSLGHFYRGHSYTAKDVDKAGLLVLRSSNIQNEKLLIDEDLQFVRKDCNDEIVLRKNDLAICMANGSKNLVGKAGRYLGDYQGRITVGAFCSIFRSKFILSQYLFETARYKRYLHISLAGTNISNLKNSELENFKFTFPESQEEQQKIAEFLTSIDKFIEFKQQQLVHAEQWKKGLMQQMFV